MTKLKTVLQINEIKKGIQSNLGDIAKIDDMSKYIDETISLNKNITKIDIKEGNGFVFECTLHEDAKKKLYLLEARLFAEPEESMVNGYLMVLDSNLNIKNEQCYDVWEIGNWKVAN